MPIQTISADVARRAILEEALLLPDNSAGIARFASLFETLALVDESGIDEWYRDEAGEWHFISDADQLSEFVYLIQNDQGHVKIGIASDVKERLTTLQVAASGRLMLIHTIGSPRNASIERVLHKKYSAQRLSGEWFALTESDIADIRAAYP